MPSFVSANSVSGASVSSVTISGFTVASGSDRILIVGVGHRANTISVSGITWNTSESFTLISGSNATNSLSDVWLYKLLAPTETTADVVVSFSASATFANAGVMYITGVDQTTPHGTAAIGAGESGTTATATVTTAAGELVVDVVFVGATAVTVGANQTSRWEIDSTRSAGGSTQDGADGGVMTWTLASDDWAIAAVPLKPVSAVIDQEGFAFGDDDGNEASHTLDTQDTNITEPVGTKTLRTLLNATDDPSSIAFKLKYQKNGSGGYADVATVSSSDITPTPDGADGTESGNNTASTSWAVSYPNAAAGDLLIFGISWDDSTSTTDVAEPAGPNGETLSEINATPAVSSNTAVRAKVWYTKATGTWTASTLTFTPTASEQWTACVVIIPAGEFDATTPIGANTTAVSAGATETDVLSAAFSAGASDGGGRVFCWTSVDADPQTGAADWTVIDNEDRGAVSGAMLTRDAVVTDNESIAQDVVTTIAGGDWCSVSFVVRPHVQTNQVYISTSANVTAGGEATTARLTAPSGKTTSDFVTGRRWDNENGSDSIDITTDDYTELEWVLTTQSPATTDDYFEFRVYNADAALSSYTVTPKWTIGSGGGTAVKDLIGMGIIPFAR